MQRKAYPSDVSDEAWALVLPYLTLMSEEAPQTLAGLNFRAFAILMIKRVMTLIASSAERALAIFHQQRGKAMLKIRGEQMDILSLNMRRQFEEQMVSHVKQFFREPCKALGDPKVREIVKYGIRRAESYGIVTKNAVGKYVNLMFAFGDNFDTDPRLPWVHTILSSEEQGPQKMERLYTAAMKKINEACGISDQALVKRG